MKICIALLDPVPPFVLIAGAPWTTRIFMNVTKAFAPADLRKNVVDVQHRYALGQAILLIGGTTTTRQIQACRMFHTMSYLLALCRELEERLLNYSRRYVETRPMAK